MKKFVFLLSFILASSLIITPPVSLARDRHYQEQRQHNQQRHDRQHRSQIEKYHNNKNKIKQQYERHHVEKHHNKIKQRQERHHVEKYHHDKNKIKLSNRHDRHRYDWHSDKYHKKYRHYDYRVYKEPRYYYYYNYDYNYYLRKDVLESLIFSVFLIFDLDRNHYLTWTEYQRRYRHADYDLLRYQFNQLDRNRDGRISRQEFLNRDRKYSHFDLNGDGVVTREEIRRYYN